MTSCINTIIIDDHPLFRDGVVMALQHDAGIAIVGQGSTAADAATLAREHKPDVMLLDIGIIGGGIESIETILTESPTTKIIMLTVETDQFKVRLAFKAGAAAYVLKGVGARDLIAIVRSVHMGEGYVTPSLAASIMSELTRPESPARRPTTNPVDALSDREQYVLRLIATGLSNREIGGQMHLSEKTVKRYVTAVLQKLHVRNRVEAAGFGRSSFVINQVNASLTVGADRIAN